MKRDLFALKDLFIDICYDQHFCHRGALCGDAVKDTRLLRKIQSSDHGALFPLLIMKSQYILKGSNGCWECF